MSTFAFGTYRITDQNPLHIEALKEAVEGSIELIDTAADYTDGGAERAIGYVLDHTLDNIRNRVKIISKCGYTDTKESLTEQLDKSLQRLNQTKIDCYLFQNPEYFLYDTIKKKMPKDAMLDAMYEQIFNMFSALEEEVENGKIDSYGISSENFSKKSDAVDFLPYEDLIQLAQKAAHKLGHTTHSFSTIELPINILEQDGLKCAKWAKENGLRVLATRPLNAHYNNLMFRLADYDNSKEYDYYLNELLEVSDDALLKPLYNIIEQMDMNKHKFGWVGEYDTFLITQIMPHIQKALQNIDKNALEDLLRYIELFLVEYRKTVAYECSLRLRTELKDIFKKCDKQIQECALEFLLEQKDIDYIVIGMKKPTYVQEILTLKN